jgi:hypothetical protein
MGDLHFSLKRVKLAEETNHRQMVELRREERRKKCDGDECNESIIGKK